MNASTPQMWEIWLFAGPRAAHGLYEQGKDLELSGATVGTTSTRHAVIQAVMRSVGEAAAFPTNLRFMAEMVSEPSLLEQLTRQWPATRLHFEPGQPVINPSWIGSGSRALGSFFEWGKHRRHADTRRVLVVLGDVVRAIDEEPANLKAPGGGRPTYPTTVVVTDDNGDDETYQWDRSDERYHEGSASERPSDLLVLLQGRTRVSIRYDGNISPAPTGNTRTDIDALRQWIDANPTRSTGGQGLASPNDGDRSARRIAALVSALRQHPEATFDLLVTDIPEFTQVGALRQLAPNVEVVVGSQLAAPAADQPLGDLLAVLTDDDPPTTAEALADSMVKRSDARGKALWLRAQNLLEDIPAGTPSALVSTAKQLLARGYDTVALRTRHAAALAQLVEGLGEQAITELRAGATRLCDALCEFVQGTRQGAHVGAGDLSELGALIDALESERRTDTAQLRTLIDDTVILQRDRRDYSEDRPLCGLTLALSHPSPAQLDAALTGSWSSVLEIIEPRPQLAWSKAERQALEDLEMWSSRSRPHDRSAGLVTTSAPYDVLEYAPTEAHRPSFDIDADLRAFLDRELRLRGHVRHLALVVRGRGTPRHPCSAQVAEGVMLPLARLSGCLREALHAHGRQAVALLVLEDPRFLSLETAHEFRDIADVLVTSTPEHPRVELDPNAARPELCEKEAARHLVDGGHLDGDRPFAQLANEWRRLVARKLGETIEGTQSIDLQSIEALCRRFDRICQLMLDNLGNPYVRRALAEGFQETRLLNLINRVQMGHHGLFNAPDHFAHDLHMALGAIYNWVRHSEKPEEQGGQPFWVRNHPAKGDRLWIDTGSDRPRDYLDLSFHHDVRLHALLTSWRLLQQQPGVGNDQAFPLWGVVFEGLSHSSAVVRDGLAGTLEGADSNLGYFYSAFDRPPLMTLSLETAPQHEGYELRLSSNESKALLFRHRSRVDLEAVDRTLEGLDFLLDRGTATHALWQYLESLGANLAEDVISQLREQLDQTRGALVGSGCNRDVHLALALPRELMRYPWELMTIPTASGPPELLGERFAVGRQMWTTEGRRAGPRHDEPLRILVIGDPETTGGATLPGARKEAEFIAQVVSEVSNSREDGMGSQGIEFRRERDVFIGQSITRAGLRRLLRDGFYDVLHFAGHGTFVGAEPERSGWLLSDGLLTVTELRNTLAWVENPPWLIFANACNSGMVGDDSTQYQGEVHGMAEACIREGVSAYVSPLWKINDESARLLASEFYRSLLVNRATVGMALHRARRYTRKVWEHSRGRRGMGDISWAGMVLFGNPTERIRESAMG